MNQIIFSMIVFALSILVGCMPRPLEPDAKNITIIYGQNTQIAKNCKLLGKISGKDVHGMKLQFTWGLEKNLKKDDVNFLKNEGEKFNANVVVFEKHQTLVKRYYTLSPNRHTDIEIHSIEGSAYRCPSHVLSTIKRLNTITHSVYEKPVIIETN
ncbi:outer membrane lipoprotein [Legionella steelei]|uniref:Outer membrane lipoprotein n=1 Tax=Legionella steelei TaxID=947033 RepID=A0A0W0ZRQ2_9GAMM|nr:DUF4156 domain-containing protein [Legionella steelei]KTD71732.1 outer membrane lipoprotein [Legionella steelei]